MVNRKVLVITIVLIAIALLATPVMATAPEKLEVFFFGGAATISPPEVWISGNVQHGEDATMTYIHPTNSFWIGIATTPTPTWLRGSSLWTADYNVNLGNGQGVLQYKVIIELSGGTFEGNVILHGEFVVVGPFAKQVNGFRYGVLHGTGDFQGWRMEISGETIDGEYYGEMYVYIS